MTLLINPHRFGTATFSPLDLSPVVWFDASALTGLSDGDQISSLTDLSGNGRHATQATSSKRPIYKVAIQNGRAVARFDGVDDELKTAAFTQAQPDTVFLVMKTTTVAANSGVVFDGIETTNRQLLAAASIDSQVHIFAGTVLQGAGATTAWQQRVILFNGASSTLRKDRTQILSGNAGSNASGGLTVGNRWETSGASFFPGDIAELFIVGSISTAERDAAETYLFNKWGVG